MAAPSRAPEDRRRQVGGPLAVGGGLVLALSTFLPWISGPGGSLTGWELYELRRDAGENPFVIDEMFADAFDPFVTGAVTLTLGLLLALLGVGFALAPRQPPGGRYSVHPALYFGGAVVGVVALLALFFDWYSLLTPPAGVDVSVGSGLVLATLGGLAALTGMGLAGTPGRTAPTAGPGVVSVPPPGWYPDPRGRHQYRYWDGATWTSNVGDGGAVTTDPP